MGYIGIFYKIRRIHKNSTLATDSELSSAFSVFNTLGEYGGILFHKKKKEWQNQETHNEKLAIWGTL